MQLILPFMTITMLPLSSHCSANSDYSLNDCLNHYTFQRLAERKEKKKIFPNKTVRANPSRSVKRLYSRTIKTLQLAFLIARTSDKDSATEGSQGNVLLLPLADPFFLTYYLPPSRPPYPFAHVLTPSHSLALPTYLPPTYLLPTYLSIYLSIYLSVYLSVSMKRRGTSAAFITVVKQKSRPR
jgi:hypothetical protein